MEIMKAPAPPLLKRSKEDKHPLFSEPIRIDWLKKMKRFLFGPRWISELTQMKRFIMLNKEGFFSLTGGPPGFTTYFKGRINFTKKSELCQISSSGSGKYCIICDWMGKQFLLMNMETMDSYECPTEDSPTFSQWVLGDSNFVVSLKNAKILHYKLTETRKRPFSFSLNVLQEIPVSHSSLIWSFSLFEASQTPESIEFVLVSIGDSSVSKASFSLSRPALGSSSTLKNSQKNPIELPEGLPPLPGLQATEIREAKENRNEGSCNSMRGSKTEETDSSGSDERKGGLGVPEEQKENGESPKGTKGKVIWKKEFGKETHLRSLSISPEHSLIAIGGLAGFISILSLKTGEVLSNSENIGFLKREACIFALSFSLFSPSLLLVQSHLGIMAVRITKEGKMDHQIDSLSNSELFSDYIFSFEALWKEGFLLAGTSDGSVFLIKLKQLE